MSYYYLKEVDFMKLMGQLIRNVLCAFSIFMAGALVCFFKLQGIDAINMGKLLKYVSR